ncbi:MAG: DUF2842 domain-containing protein [Beijerinckiaceae bacterium]
MTTRTRKLLGTIIIIAFVLFYAMIVTAMIPRVILDMPRYWQWVFYIVAGLAWVLPLMPMIRWMEKRDPAERNSKP